MSQGSTSGISAWNSRNVSSMSTTCASIPRSCQASSRVFSSPLCQDENRPSGRRGVFEPRHPSLRAAASICAFRDFGHLSELCVAPCFQRHPSSCCILSRPSTQLANSGSGACAARASVIPSNFPSARISPKTFPSVLCGLLAPRPVCVVVRKVVCLRRPSWRCGAG